MRERFDPVKFCMEERHRQHKSQRDLARSVGCGVNTIINFEHGMNTGYMTVLEIFDALGFEIGMQRRGQ